MISKLSGLAFIIHGLELQDTSNMQSQGLLLVGAALIIGGIKWKEHRLRENR